MTPPEQFIESEFPQITHRSILPKLCSQAYGAVASLVADNPILQCPSAQIGHIRVWAVEFALKRAIDSGELAVEGCEWASYGNRTGKYLRVFTKNAVVTTNQLPHPGFRPRKADFRTNAMQDNQMVLIEPESQNIDGKAHLIIIHGHQSLSFIHVAMPNPVFENRIWLGISPNAMNEIHIASTPNLAPVEGREIAPVISIKESLISKIEQDGH